MAPSKTKGFNSARAAYIADDHAAGPLPMITTFSTATRRPSCCKTCKKRLRQSRRPIAADDETEL
jgi:hypothetical protein